MTQKVQAAIVVATILGCFVWSHAFAKSAAAPVETQLPSATTQVKKELKPNTTIMAPENAVLACARLSREING
ncbi:MAG: hypothetical protein V2I36_19605, partial [Desulfopila sp.]|nr:hypothetical protein [Desulfopila sp.]